MNVRNLAQGWVEETARRGAAHTQPPQRPTWTCPTCYQPRLRVDTISTRSMSASGLGLYIGAAICDSCHQVSRMCGSLQGMKNETTHTKVFEITYFDPSPVILLRRPGLHNELVAALPRIERLFWVDAPACGNAIRGLVELFLRLRRVKSAPTLHRRIENFGTLVPHLAEHLMAVKWLGNAGSHAAKPLVRNDVLDALEQVDFIFEKVFSDREKPLKKKAKAINTRKGPVRRK